MYATLYRSLSKSLRNVLRHHDAHLSLPSLIRCQFPPGSGIEIISENELEFGENDSSGYFAIPNDSIELDETIDRFDTVECRKILRECFETTVLPKQIKSLFGNEQTRLDLSVGFDVLRRLHTLESVLTDSIGLYDIRHRRDKNVKYAVGDIVIHKLFGAGVITSWDERCGAHSEWIERNSIRTLLRDGTEQPFYSILMSDGTIRYCSQENLRLDVCKDTEVTHDSIPFFFQPKKKNEAGYELNKHTRSIFPSDESFRDARSLNILEDNNDSNNSGLDQVLEASESDLLEMVRSDRALSSFALERLQTLWQNECGEDAAQLLEIANKAIGENELETAEVILTGLFESYPDWPQLLNTMAHHSFVSNDYERALDLCEQSISINPNHLITLNSLVEYNLTIGNLKNAKLALERSLEAMPFASIWPPELLGSLLSDDDDNVDGGVVDFFRDRVGDEDESN